MMELFIFLALLSPIIYFIFLQVKIHIMYPSIDDTTIEGQNIIFKREKNIEKFKELAKSKASEYIKRYSEENTKKLRCEASISNEEHYVYTHRNIYPKIRVRVYTEDCEPLIPHILEVSNLEINYLGKIDLSDYL